MVDTFGLFTPKRRLSLLKMAIIGGFVCSLPITAYLTSKSNLFPILLILAGIAPIGIFLLLRHIELGLVAMLFAGVFVRFRLPTGTASEIVMSLLLCGGLGGLWLMHMVMVEKHIKLKPAPINFPLLAFMVTVFVSLAWNQVYRDALVQNIGSPFVAVISAAVIVLLPGTLLLISNLITDERWLQAIVWIFLAEGAVSLIISLIADLGIGPTSSIRQLVWYNGFLWINSQGIFHLWYVAFALAFVSFNRRLHPAWKVALLVYVAGWIYWGFFLRTSWLSGWVPTFATGAVIAFFRSKKVFIILLVLLVVAGSYYAQTALDAESKESGGTRLAAYAVNWRITGKHLLLGTGPAGYASYYMTYFPMEGMASHSNYIDIISQTGIVGSFFLLWFFAAHLWSSLKVRRRLYKQGDFSECLSVAVIAGTIGCLVAMALGDWLFPFTYTQGIVGFDSAMFNWFFMGLLWALRHSLDSKASPAHDLPTEQGATA